LKPASTPSWHKDKWSVISFQFSVKTKLRLRSRLCSGRCLPRASRGLRRALFFLATVLLATAQSTRSQSGQKVAAHRANELTIAGLRPGQATAREAIRRMGESAAVQDPSQSRQLFWADSCREDMLTVDLDEKRRIQVIRLGRNIARGGCVVPPPKKWHTGRGLKVYDDANTALRIYGQPDSKSPSTRDGQPLELWYYAFDWAGPDVPQVMEILCTREKEGQPGRVVEITLAAPSL
jgi:hypothetical protein